MDLVPSRERQLAVFTARLLYLAISGEGEKLVLERAERLMGRLVWNDDLEALRVGLSEFFSLYGEGGFYKDDLSFLETHDQELVEECILGVLCGGACVRLLTDLIQAAERDCSMMSVTLRAGEMLARWRKLDPHFCVVGPALLSFEARGARRERVPVCDIAFAIDDTLLLLRGEGRRDVLSDEFVERPLLRSEAC
jgi:hypothetical protein